MHRPRPLFYFCLARPKPSFLKHIEVSHEKMKQAMYKLIETVPSQHNKIARHIVMTIVKVQMMNSSRMAKELHKIIDKMCHTEEIPFKHVDLTFERLDAHFFCQSVFNQLGNSFQSNKSKLLRIDVSQKYNTIRLAYSLALPYTIVSPPKEPKELLDNHKYVLQVNVHKPCRYVLFGDQIPHEIGYIYQGHNRKLHNLFKSQMEDMTIAFMLEDKREFPVGWLSCAKSYKEQQIPEAEYWRVPFDTTWIKEES
ncbi:hypothetical protein L596_030754 [Steinernema carpocapsae]|uniref:Uncharacterized protein n=1 Tax=Steinernema carpocapsae TaxID=34508 RepID=A0A4U5LNQ7_STECR|nr:hypothetical protein L596_030754 [Steinernema carpocapsae]